MKNITCECEYSDCIALAGGRQRIDKDGYTKFENIPIEECAYFRYQLQKTLDEEIEKTEACSNTNT